MTPRAEADLRRDNFRKSVVTELRERVANRCSNPQCRVPTTAAIEGGGGGVNSIGVAAHITAAAPLGPRYDGTLTAAKRRAFENGIWLCASCSVKIDRDAAKHTVEALQGWKSSAEAAAIAELGRPLPDARDTIDTLAAALTASGPRFIASAVANAAKATSTSLEALDRRFAVAVTYDGATTRFQMNARVDVPVKLRLFRERGIDLGAIGDALSTGQDIEVPMQAVEVEGSPLLRHAVDRGGTLRIEPHKVPIVARLSFASATGAEWRFDDVVGSGAVGTKGISFAGEACGGLVSMQMRAERDVPTAFKLNVSYERWRGVDVRALPHWESVYGLVERFVAGDAVRVAFFKAGVAGPSGTASLNQPQPMRALLWLFQHAGAAMVVAKLTNTAIAFDRWSEIAPQDHVRLVQLAREIERGGVLRASDLEGSPRFRVKLVDPHADFAALLGPGNFRIDEPEGDVVRAFGQPIRLPPRHTTFEAVEPRVEGPCPDGYFDVELAFTPRSAMRVEYFDGSDASSQSPPVP